MNLESSCDVDENLRYQDMILIKSYNDKIRYYWENIHNKDMIL
jgi:hypothetical protein